MRADFFAYWQAAALPASYEDSVRLHETQFTAHFAALGYRWDTFVDTKDLASLFVNPIMACPKLLLADDPTKGIDVQARYDLHRSFINMANKGSAVVMVSSDDEELVELCKMTPNSRVLIMYEGRISMVLTGADISVENIIAYSFGGTGGESV